MHLCRIVQFGFLISTIIVSMAAISSSNVENALQDYLDEPDPTFSWTVRERNIFEDFALYEIYMRSQTWHDIVWTHQLRIFVPHELKDSRHALLFINGGRNREGEPKWKNRKDTETQLIGGIASKTGALVTILRQVPNQPLFGGKKEDEIISYTFQQYMETEDATWPLLFPMVKSAVRAMDAVTVFSERELGKLVNKYVIAGASKRGWTTWLAGASDPRVVAIAPMVIDMLNLSPQMDYQLKVWNEYSDQIADYTQLGIQERLEDSVGQALARMVDPYAYRDRLTMPKLIFLGTNDPYWPVDAIKFYFDDLKGENYIHYVPNAGHGLGSGLQAAKALAGFFATCLKGLPHPKVEWNISCDNPHAILHFMPDTHVKRVKLWIARSDDRDFRDERWYPTRLQIEDSSYVPVEVLFPKHGYKAFYVEGIFSSPIGGTYAKSTRVYVLDSNGAIQ